MSLQLQRTPWSRKGLVGLLSTITLNVALIGVLLHLQTYPFSTQAAQSPTVSVAEQQDAPLMIIVDGYDVSNPSAPQVRYKVQNISGKAVRAYTILEEIVRGKSKLPGANIVNLGKEPKFLQPMQTRTESCDLPSPTDLSSQTDTVTSLTLAVDYVEFGDGTTWGKDTRHSAEYLAGQREGKKATVKKIQEMRGKKGDAEVGELLKRKDAEVVAPPAGHSTEWEYGFRVGHNAAMHRLRFAHSKGGAQELASELQRESEDVERREQ